MGKGLAMRCGVGSAPRASAFPSPPCCFMTSEWAPRHPSHGACKTQEDSELLLTPVLHGMGCTQGHRKEEEGEGCGGRRALLCAMLTHAEGTHV